METRTVNAKNESLKIMTYNVLLDFHKTGREPDFPVKLVESVRGYAPDILGTQETTSELHEKCLSMLDGYTCYRGEAYTENNLRGNYIYWRADKFKALEMGHRYMTDTPTVRSKLEGSREYRGFNYLYLESAETGNRFLFLNLHADYRANEETRVMQLKAVTAFLQEAKWKDAPAIVVGDFNSTASQACIPAFLADNPRMAMTSEIAEAKGDTGPTLIADEFTKRIPYVFDFIFVTKDRINTMYYSVLDNVTDGKYPSDHLPVVADLEI